LKFGWWRNEKSFAYVITLNLVLCNMDALKAEIASKRKAVEEILLLVPLNTCDEGSLNVCAKSRNRRLEMIKRRKRPDNCGYQRKTEYYQSEFFYVLSYV
jgi:hypothetical protein